MKKKLNQLAKDYLKTIFSLPNLQIKMNTGMLKVKKFPIISTTLIALIVLLVSSATLYAASVSLSWQPNTEPDLAGYKIYYDTNEDGDYLHVLDIGNHSDYTFTDLMDGETYRVSVTAYDLYNNESDFSPEITFTTPEAASAEFKLELGEVLINNEWLRVEYEQNFVDPVVVASPLSRNNADPAIVRIRNVDETGFEIRVQEWDYQNDDHGNESVSYLVMERGTYILDDGTRLEAGKFTTDYADSFKTVNFDQDFQVIPVVMSSVTTVNDNNTVIGRLQNIHYSSFQYILQEQEHNAEVHTEETVMYIAWEPSQGTIDGVVFDVDKPGSTVSSSEKTINFNQQFTESPILLANMQSVEGGDPANLRYRNKTKSSIIFKVCEEKSADKETKHKAETVGYLAFANAAGNDNSNEDTGDTNDGSGDVSNDDGNTQDQGDTEIPDPPEDLWWLWWGI